MIYERSKIFWSDVLGEAEERAWERAGFRNGKKDLIEAVRRLTPEEKAEILTEVFMEDAIKKYFENYLYFQESLGKNMFVSKEEMIEFAKKEYPGCEIREDTFMFSRICPKDLSLYTIKDLRKKW